MPHCWFADLGGAHSGLPLGAEPRDALGGGIVPCPHSRGRRRLHPSCDSLPPLDSVGEPEDIAYGILYLAADESTFVTGSELTIDGDYTAC